MNVGETFSVTKSGDQSVTNNTTLQSDTDLTVPIGAGEVWDLEQVGSWVSTTTCGFAWAFDVPSGATFTGRHNGTSTLGNASNLDLTTPRSASSAPNDGVNQLITGRLDNSGGSAGNVTFKFAQKTATVGQNATTKGTTTLKATRVA